MKEVCKLMNEKKIIVIRSASKREYREIVGLYREMGWLKKGSVRSDIRKLEKSIRGSHCFLCAINKGIVVGMVRAVSDGAGFAYILDLAVKKEFRKMGIAEKLINAVEKCIRQFGIKYIDIIANPFLKNLMLRRGYREYNGYSSMFRQS